MSALFLLLLSSFYKSSFPYKKISYICFYDKKTIREPPFTSVDK